MRKRHLKKRFFFHTTMKNIDSTSLYILLIKNRKIPPTYRSHFGTNRTLRPRLEPRDYKRYFKMTKRLFDKYRIENPRWS